MALELDDQGSRGRRFATTNLTGLGNFVLGTTLLGSPGVVPPYQREEATRGALGGVLDGSLVGYVDGQGVSL